MARTKASWLTAVLWGGQALTPRTPEQQRRADSIRVRRGTFSVGDGPVSCRFRQQGDERMKKSVLVLLALLALLPFAQAMAQTAPAATAPVPDTATAQFLATLAGGQGQTPAPNDLVPAPSFMASCTSTTQCPSGQLCCNVCGNPPDDGGSCRACVTPVRGRCPLIA
jgi:hypothetical protein